MFIAPIFECGQGEQKEYFRKSADFSHCSNCTPDVIANALEIPLFLKENEKKKKPLAFFLFVYLCGQLDMNTIDRVHNRTHRGRFAKWEKIQIQKIDVKYFVIFLFLAFIIPR